MKRDEIDAEIAYLQKLLNEFDSMAEPLHRELAPVERRWASIINDIKATHITVPSKRENEDGVHRFRGEVVEVDSLRAQTVWEGGVKCACARETDCRHKSFSYQTVQKRVVNVDESARADRLDLFAELLRISAQYGKSRNRLKILKDGIRGVKAAIKRLRKMREKKRLPAVEVLDGQLEMKV